MVLRKLLIPATWLIVSLALLNCGGSSPSGTHTSGISYRAFVSNSVSAGTSIAGLYIVNAQLDVHPPNVSAISAGNNPGMMVLTPNRIATLVATNFNNGSNPPNPTYQVVIISNTKETSTATLTMPGYTESMVISPDSSTAFVAMPNAPVPNQSPGALELISVGAGAFAGQIDIPSVHYLSITNGGSRLLAFSSTADTTDAPCSTAAPCFLYVVTPSNLGTSQPVFTAIPSNPSTNSLDHPVAAFFSSDDTTAYIINCGPECGGTQASVQVFDMTTNTPGASVPLPAASEALLDGSTMYIAGTPYTSGPNGGPSQPCTGEVTAATTCGILTILDLNSMQTVQPPNCASGQQCPIIITDGYHNRIAMGPYGQLYIGAGTCTEIVPPQPPPVGAEVRGCLSIYNSMSTAAGNVPPGGVVIPPANGDVTGIQPISSRNLVYLIQGYPVPGGSLRIYCTTTNADLNCPATDALQIAPTNEPSYAPLMVGNFFDVITVDF